MRSGSTPPRPPCKAPLTFIPTETLAPPAPLFFLFFSLFFSYFLAWLIQRPESLCGVCRNRTERPARPGCRRRGKWPDRARPGCRRRGKWPDRARRFLFKMVGPGRMVTPGTGPILKTTRRFQVRLPFLPQAKRRGRKGKFICMLD